VHEKVSGTNAKPFKPSTVPPRAPDRAKGVSKNRRRTVTRAHKWCFHGREKNPQCYIPILWGLYSWLQHRWWTYMQDVSTMRNKYCTISPCPGGNGVLDKILLSAGLACFPTRASLPAVFCLTQWNWERAPWFAASWTAPFSNQWQEHLLFRIEKRYIIRKTTLISHKYFILKKKMQAVLKPE